MIFTERRLARPRSPWPLRAALGALLVFANGLALLALLSGYDVLNWDAVTARSRASYALDDHGVGFAAAWFMAVGLVVVPVVTIVAVVLLATAMLRGSRAAWAAMCVLTGSYLLCCGSPSPRLA